MKFLLLLCISFILISNIYCAKRRTQKLHCDDEDFDGPIESFEVDFHLSTPTKNVSAKIKTGKKLSAFLQRRNFSSEIKTALVIHGFLNDHKEDWVEKMRKRLLKWEPMNVILVDWSQTFLNHRLNYRAAAMSTELAAVQIAKMLQNMANATGRPLKTWQHLHFIGHSLGAHVAGQAARRLKKGKLVHRVTGLDPASPCFEKEDVDLRLKATDARFVDVIHTNSEYGLNPNLGLYDPVGHLDFYPNGGNSQPECDSSEDEDDDYYLDDETETEDEDEEGESSDDYNENVLELIKDANDAIIGKVASFITRRLFKYDGKDLVLNYIKNTYDILCDHGEAPRYFIKSLSKKAKPMWANPVNFPINVTDTLKCQNRNCNSSNGCIQMGINADLCSSKRGQYFMDTTKQAVKC